MARLWGVAGHHYRPVEGTVPGGGGPPPPGGLLPFGNLPGWTQIYAQDFNIDSPSGSILTKYPGIQAFDGFNDTSGRGAYSKNAPTVTAHDSMLDIWIHYDAIANKRYVACILPGGWTPQVNGKYTWRMHCDLVAQYKFVALQWSTRDVWADGELDFPEGNIGSGFSEFLHNATGTPASNEFTHAFTGLSGNNDYIYDLEWTPVAITATVKDGPTGVLLQQSVCTYASKPNAFPVNPMRFELQFEVADLSGATIPLTTNTGHCYIDWVTQYTYAPVRHRIQGWRGSAHYIPPLFVQGTTLPQSSGDPDALGATENVGYMASNNGTTMTSAGTPDLVVAPGATVSYKRIQGFVTLGAGAILDHCIVEGRLQSSFISNALVTAANGSKIQYCTLRPSAAALAGNIAYWLNGVNITGTVTVQRCVISRVVDSWRSGTTGTKINFWSNLVRDYCFFDNDLDQAGSTPSEWSHADCGGQRTQATTGDSIIGNAIWSFMDMTGVTFPGGVATAGAGTVGMPQTALNNGYPNGDWGNLLSYTNVGGHVGWYIGFNWFHGGNNASFQITVGTGSSGKLEGNRFGCDGVLLGSGKKVLTKWPSGTTVDVSGAPNVFDTTTDVPVALRGHPLTDAAPMTATGFSVIPGNF